LEANEEEEADKEEAAEEEGMTERDKERSTREMIALCRKSRGRKNSVFAVQEEEEEEEIGTWPESLAKWKAMEPQVPMKKAWNPSSE
jgi:hypothetical protein